jgi:hypothetical protein
VQLLAGNTPIEVPESARLLLALPSWLAISFTTLLKNSLSDWVKKQPQKPLNLRVTFVTVAVQVMALPSWP